MYESLLTYCGIKQFQVSDKLYTSPESVTELNDTTVIIISRGYADRIREHFTGEIIEVSASTFKDLIESMKKLKDIAKEKTINKKITEITEMREQYIDKTIGLTTAVSPSTNMAVEIAKELRLPISAKGKKLAPDYSITADDIDAANGALIQIPTHQKNIDVIERINERYRSIIDQIKQIEEGYVPDHQSSREE
jgi:segregation and condensation protein B